MSATSFAELGLRPELLRAVDEAGYTTPTPIQVQAIPVILAGKDVMGGAQTGTGKTAGFALPILQKLLPHGQHEPVARAPSGARADPHADARARGAGRGIVPHLRQVHEPALDRRLRRRRHQAAARRSCAAASRSSSPRRAGCSTTSSRRASTSARSRSSCSTKPTGCSTWASSRTSSGSWRCCPSRAKRQNLLFSATFSNEIKKLADQLLNAPQLIEVAKRNTAAETVSQSAYKVPADAKRALLEHLVRSRNLTQVLCFVRTKHGASRLARQLEKDGLVTDAIHGDKTQQARMEALAAFKEGKLQVLVATDVAARGLDIDDLPLVVNYELPHVPEDYIHRIGRTGRAGASGEAISFVAPEEERYLADIERLLKKKIDVATAPEGFDIATAPPRRAPQRAPRAAARGSGAARRPCTRATRNARGRSRVAGSAERRRAPPAKCRSAMRRAPARAARRGARNASARMRSIPISRRSARGARRRVQRRSTQPRRAAAVVRPRPAGPRAADEAHGARAGEGLNRRSLRSAGTAPIMVGASRASGPLAGRGTPSACR